METNNASTNSNPADKPANNKPTSRPRDPQDRAALTVPFEPAADGLRARFAVVVAP